MGNPNPSPDTRFGQPNGNQGNGGRPQGSKNKATLALRKMLDEVNFNWAEEFSSAWIDNKIEKLDLLIKMLPYVSRKIHDTTPEPKEETIETKEQKEERVHAVLKKMGIGHNDKTK